jgi:hypothetical protein
VLVRESARDPLLKKPIDIRYTGYRYGYIHYSQKKKKLVFKKGLTPKPGEKLGRGAECSINSTTSEVLKNLEQLGETLRKSGSNDLGMNEVELGRRRIQNSVRICTVMDLVLRYMDKKKTFGKRWFYRALEAKLHGHPAR